MSRGIIIALMIFGIALEVFKLWAVRKTTPQLTILQRIALWIKQISMLLVLLFGGLFLILPAMQDSLGVFLIISSTVWVASTITCRVVGARLALPTRGVTASTWSPFQSSEVREICAHLTPTEHTKMIEDARRRGRLIAQWFAFPLTVVLLALWWSHQLGLALVVAFAGYLVFWILPRARVLRRRSVELLCATQWARSQNYSADRFKLMSFPWSK